jgi:hypothetical protein
MERSNFTATKIMFECRSSAFGDDDCRMLEVVQLFDKYLFYHLQDEYVLAGHFISLV